MQDPLAFAEELEEVALALSSLDPAPKAAEITQTIGAVIEEYKCLELAAAMFEAVGVQETCQWVSAILAEYEKDQPQAIIELLSMGDLTAWIELAAITLREPGDTAHLSALTLALVGDAWPNPPGPELLEKLLLSLRLSADDEQQKDNTEVPAWTESSQVSAEAPDQSLDWDQDIHPELLDAYLQETPGLVGEAAGLIRSIAQGNSQADDVQHAARLVHTIKGASAVVGVEAIAKFTHRLEDLFEQNIHPYLDQGLDKTLVASADCLEAMIENLQESKTLPKSYTNLISEIDQWVQKVDAASSGEIADAEDDTVLNKARASPAVNLPDFIRQSGMQDDQGEAADEEQANQTRPKGGTYLSVPVESVQALLNLAGELITSTSQITEHAKQALDYAKQIRQQEVHVREMLDELSETIDQQHELRKEADIKFGNKFEKLELEVYNDLHSIYGLLNESVADSHALTENVYQQIQQLSEQVYQQQRMQRRLSDTVLRTRLVPVNSLVARLERTVRETCRSTGKKASITISGDNQQVDTDILRGLTPALLHLLRNAVDHGIELPEERIALGKPEEGKIELSFVQKGNAIHLYLKDDGKGLDVNALRTRAIEQSIITQDQVLSEEDTLRLIFKAGFTTQDEVTEISGRGVGMDVVRNAVENLQGSVRLDSILGEGMRIQIQVPLTLIATNAILVRAAGNLVAIPGNTVQRLIYTTDTEIIKKQGQLYVLDEEEQIEVVQLAHLLGWQIQSSGQKGHTFLLVDSDDGRYAIQVEELLQPRDIVVKSLTSWFDISLGMSGACILANGAIAPVLDPLRLLRNFEPAVVQLDNARVTTLKRKADRSVILIVDDSLSNRKSLSLMVEQMGYKAITAVDGLDALQQLNVNSVEIVLVDLEMPRMNGLEMTQSVRDWPEQSHLPIVMITSRTTQKHRDMAKQAGVDDYLTKPVEQSTLGTLLSKWLRTRLAS